MVFGPYLYGALASALAGARLSLALRFLCFVMAPLSLMGVLTFHGVFGLPHFVMIYPFFCTVLLAVELWGEYLFVHEGLKQESEVGRLARQAAHDIRSPLAALAALEHSWKDDDRSMSADDREILSAVVKRMRSIAEGLSDRKNPAGEIWAASSKSCDAGNVVRAVVQECRLRFRDVPSLDISTSIPPGLGPLGMVATEIEFGRVISNLVTNAVEAVVSVKRLDARVSVSVSTKGNTCITEISDNGPGIPSEVLERLGERGVTSGKASGSGLGLHHACASVQQWGGRIELQTDPATGTVVRIILPMVSE